MTNRGAGTWLLAAIGVTCAALAVHGAAAEGSRTAGEVPRGLSGNASVPMAAKPKPGKGAGSANIRSDFGATSRGPQEVRRTSWGWVEDAARRRVAAVSGAEGVSGQAPKPHIVLKPIRFGTKRRAETAAYARRHYGIDTWRLEHPRVIVEHYTASLSFASTYSYFASDTPDPELGELPGVCAHFVVDRDGTIYQLVPLNTMCRHTVGLNWTAFGIEHVATSDRQILHNSAQLSGSLSLTLWLMSRYHIQLRNVIGHNESLTSPYHRERYRAWRCQTHGDWRHADMELYRSALARLARRYGVPLGPPARPVTPRCP